MRITGGTHSGRPLRAPRGTSTRPTADRVREAVFSRLEAVAGGCEGAVVLDAYAGSGALAAEALSRGAGAAVFVDRSRAASAVIRENLASLGLADEATVLTGDVAALARGDRLGAVPFTLLFLDPPYRINKSEVRALIELLAQRDRLAPDAAIVWEYETGGAADWPEGVASLGTRRYGSTEVDIAIFERRGEVS